MNTKQQTITYTGLDTTKNYMLFVVGGNAFTTQDTIKESNLSINNAVIKKTLLKTNDGFINGIKVFQHLLFASFYLYKIKPTSSTISIVGKQDYGTNTSLSCYLWEL